MKNKQTKTLLFAAILMLVVSACAPAQATEVMVDKTTEVMVETTSVAEMPQETSSPEMMDKPEQGAMMNTPSWYTAALTNVNTGENFTIDDYKGKVILVETMAQWCSNCKKQQAEVKILLEKLGMPADLVVVVLDIDPNGSNEALKSYAANNGYDWVYAISPEAVSREISNLYGAQFTNPPSTPMLVIDRKGEAHPLPFGIKSADDLMKAIEPFLKDM